MFVGNTKLSLNHFAERAALTKLNIMSRMNSVKDDAQNPKFRVDTFSSASPMYNRMKEVSNQFKRVFAEAQKNAIDMSSNEFDWEKHYDTIFSYTKDSVVKHQWDMRQPSLPLEGLLEQGTKKIQIPDGWQPSSLQSASTLSAFEDELKVEGLSPEMDWSRLSIDFQKGTIPQNESHVLGDRYGVEIVRKTDYIASRFVAAESKIVQNTSGSERDAQLGRLNDMLDYAVSQSADNYANAISSRLEQFGVFGEFSKIHDSVIQAVNSQIEAYRQELGQSESLRVLQDTDDGWLLNDDAYVASVLRDTANITTEAVNAGSSSYTITDLSMFAEITRTGRQATGADPFLTSEESYGLRLASFTMDLDSIKSGGQISANFNETLQRLIDNYTSKAIDNFANSVEQKRSSPAIYADVRGFASVNKNLILKVYNQTMSYYYNGNRADDAFMMGADFAVQQYRQSQEVMTGVYRYNSSMVF